MLIDAQCLDFCQMLAGKSLFFSFSLTVGNNFSFSVESRGKAALSSPTKKHKKPTPSTVRRNARRREEFLKRKLASAAEESRYEVSEEEAKTPGEAPTVLHHHPSPSPSSERRQKEGEQGAHLQPAGWGYSCCQEGDDITLRVLIQAGVGDRPSCDP